MADETGLHEEANTDFNTLMQQPTELPSRKVSAQALGGALVAVAAWATSTFAGLDIPADVAAALTVVTGFVAGYLTRDRVL